MKHRVDEVLKARDMLAALPDAPVSSKEFVTSREAVTLMEDVLQGLKKKGYTNDMIVHLLHEQGIEISKVTLRQYLAQGGNGMAPSKRPRKNRHANPEKLPVNAPAAKSKRDPEPKSIPPKGAFPVRGDTEEL